MPWVLLFLFLVAANVQTGGTNANARISGLRAIVEGGSLNTDRYRDWTEDWALAPSGHYYPNKAPGGVLLGLPIFAMIDIPARLIAQSPRDREGKAPPPGLFELFLFSFLMQAIPYAVLVAWICRRFEPMFEGAGPLYFFVLAALFGNTAALYMGCYFGHGLAALFTLAGFAAWLRGRYGAASALLAASLLTDYGTACVLPFFLAATIWREGSAKPLKGIFAGALPFAALWVWYHWTAFGSPFALAIKYSNPSQIEATDGGVWGMYRGFPSPHVVGRLLLGSERGILCTQPWVLGLIALPFAPVRLPKGTKLFLAGGFCGLLWMNASVGGWHGGATLGPRYLCLIFPSVALALALSWRDLGRAWHASLWVGLAVSVAFRILVFPFSVIPPIQNLWEFHISQYGEGVADQDPLRLLGVALAGFLAAATWTFLREGGARRE